MPEPFKNIFNKSLIHNMAIHLATAWPGFDQKKFKKLAGRKLETLELKQRSTQITDALSNCLPNDYDHAASIMLSSLGNELCYDLSAGEKDTQGISGWAVMPMAHYVAIHGQGSFDRSMTLLKEMTKRSSSEFAIRYFLLESPQKTLKVLKSWAYDPNFHVRRLVSEGTRPRLPWAQQLPQFIRNPNSVIELLDILKDDNEEYVRRSVANNLNDISKDHPALVANIAKDWIKDANEERKKLIKHGCRSLLKQGHKKTLNVFGYTSPKLQQAKLHVSTPKVTFGQHLEFGISLQSDIKRNQLLMIDYVVHHQKANGSLSPKVFKWTTKHLPAQGKLQITKKHPMKYVTTRVYYPGLHRLEVIINGKSVGCKDFELLKEDRL